MLGPLDLLSKSIQIWVAWIASRCNLINCSMPFFPSSSRLSICSRVKGEPSAVPCTSMNLPSPVQTMFMSTSARESSSYFRSSNGVPSTMPTLIAATSLTIGDFFIFRSCNKRVQAIENAT